MAEKNNKNKNVPSVPKANKNVPSVPKTDALKEASPTLNKKSNYLDYSTKVRSMSIQCYCPPTHWGTLLKEAYRYAYILHDKDVDADGILKTPHYHIVVRFASPRYRSAVEKMFDLEGLTEDTTINFQRVKSLGSIFGYLTHRTASSSDKHQYEANEVISNDISYFTTCSEAVSSEGDKDTGNYTLNSTFLEDLTADDFNLHSMCLRYGRDFMKNYRTYQMLRYDLIHTEEVKHAEEQNRIATTELLNNLNTADNANELPSDVDVIARFIADNVLANKSCDYGADTRKLESFLIDVRKAVAKLTDLG